MEQYENVKGINHDFLLNYVGNNYLLITWKVKRTERGETCMVYY